MKQITKELNSKIGRAYVGKGKIKWSDIFDNEDELVKVAMLNNNVLRDVRNMNIKGFAYLESFQRYYGKNGYLTEKQITQLKRLAIQIAYSAFYKPY